MLASLNNFDLLICSNIPYKRTLINLFLTEFMKRFFNFHPIFKIKFVFLELFQMYYLEALMYYKIIFLTFLNYNFKSIGLTFYKLLTKKFKQIFKNWQIYKSHYSSWHMLNEVDYVTIITVHCLLTFLNFSPKMSV